MRHKDLALIAATAAKVMTDEAAAGAREPAFFEAIETLLGQLRADAQYASGMSGPTPVDDAINTARSLSAATTKLRPHISP